jgi:hypothetical protein
MPHCTQSACTPRCLAAYRFVCDLNTMRCGRAAEAQHVAGVISFQNELCLFDLAGLVGVHSRNFSKARSRLLGWQAVPGCITAPLAHIHGPPGGLVLSNAAAE